MMDFHVSKQTSMLFCVFQNFTMPNKIDKQRLHLDKLAANSRNVQPKCIPSDQDILPEQLPPHLSAFPNASKEEIFCEYTNFLRTLPLMLEKEQTKVINAVKTYLDIETIVKNIDVNYHHDRVSKKAGVTLKNQILCKKIF